jgi:DNA-directed RNA polymerase I subunit RPA49
VLPGPISFETFEKARTTTPVNLHGSKASTLESTEFLLHSSKHPTISYTSNEDIQEEKLLKHFVGVFDPRTGEVEVMEARKMTVRGLVQRDAKEEEEEREGEKQTVRLILSGCLRIWADGTLRIAHFGTNLVSPLALKNPGEPLRPSLKMR